MNYVEYLGNKAFLEIFEEFIKDDPSFWLKIEPEKQDKINEMKKQVDEYTANHFMSNY